jgi:hypothetical protein
VEKIQWPLILVERVQWPPILVERIHDRLIVVVDGARWMAWRRLVPLSRGGVSLSDLSSSVTK